CRLLWRSFFFSSRRRHTRSKRDWSSDVCSSDLEDEIVAFLPLGHPLTSKAILTWEDLAEYPLVSLSDKYQTYFKVMEQFSIRGLEPHCAYTSFSWQYLTDAIQRNFVITLMPSLVPTFSSTDNIIINRIKNPASFNMFVSRLNKKHYSKENKLFYDFLNQHLPKSNKLFIMF